VNVSVSATVVGAAPSLESALFVTVTVRVVHAGRALKRPRYALRWPGGAKDGRLARDIPAGTTEITLRVAPDAGDLDALLAAPDRATVALT
jgi:hypothetical protein